MHGLKRSDPVYLWLLHHLFLAEINQDCQEFIETWNSKPISGKEGQNRTPNDMQLDGITCGMYTNISPHDTQSEMDENDVEWTVDGLVQCYGTEGEICD
jgi:hypothetical protein